MEQWLQTPSHASIGHDTAIRKYCSERLEQEQQGDSDEASNELEMWSSSGTNSPSLAAAEQVEFVDGLINMEWCYEEDGNLASKCGFASHSETVTISRNYGIEEFMALLTPGSSIEEEIDVISSIEPTNSESLIPPHDGDAMNEMSQGVDEGLHLVHLLLACAEAVGCRDSSLANSILSQIWGLANPHGDSMQRVSFCFALGLTTRLALQQNVGLRGSFSNLGLDLELPSKEDKVEGFRLLYQLTPYIAFGFTIANDAIDQAAHGKDALHIIDLGMAHTLQWPPLIRTLASRLEGPPKLRITGVDVDPNSKELEENMKVLAMEASSLGVPFEFQLIVGPLSPSLLNMETLGSREGEALFVNSIMYLHKHVKESRGSLKSILQSIRKLNPTLFTLVEQEANHNGPFFLGRFLESLHYYSAIFDSLEASLPRPSPQRMKIERSHFAEEIRDIIAYEGLKRVERHERADQWRRQLGRAGFQVVGLKSMSQARMMLSVYGCDGYTLATEKGGLVLGWKGRSIMLASTWQVHSASPSNKTHE
ncbi:hypothetical protein AMTRI_Chr02g217370 [Amborella trichopoda]|uniref:Uncharacterized protein n=1 Tax=Amborella trichopoda TaxID=13333 RepID=W1NF64_AMBTC|nr:DELLA protein RGL1 [Amborella trichopoda]ERM93780.1 hypothetical protein AMTR_s00004p00270570 [Amborella trichopoda]|eukprot:XP_006826543.1 DELLA protein RGL1 [Amborella trichopoda]